MKQALSGDFSAYIAEEALVEQLAPPPPAVVVVSPPAPKEKKGVKFATSVEVPICFSQFPLHNIRFVLDISYSLSLSLVLPLLFRMKASC
jgi:hypothetical protein